MAAVTTRPNIRIEIQNNLVEPMEVDENVTKGESDFEDGEINDESTKENKFTQPAGNARIWSNKEEGFATGIDIFNEKEHEKLQERANRFGLNPEEISNFTNDDLLKLHTSLGISGNNERDIRFEAIHLRGTDEMSTEDVFEYFGKYVPNCIEWIDDESCNVVWQDKLSAARALHFISKAVKGMPVEGSCDPFTKHLTESDEKEHRSVLLANSNREVEIAKDDLDDEDLKGNDESVNLSDISVPIPPGYWRLGVSHPKAKVLLLRFAFKTDKKPLKAERFSEYYKKYGNPNFGGLKGLISGSCRNKFKGIFDRNKDIANAIVDTKNPWGDLAENWNADEKYSEQHYFASAPKAEETTPIVSGKSEVLKRLGVKRRHEPIEEVPEEPTVKKVSKVPRMRMYADEEEVKIKRKKQLLEIKKKNQEVSQTSDLRNMLGLKKERDLGVKLKNRQRKEDNRSSNNVLDSKPLESSTRHSHKEKSTRHSSPSEHHSRHTSSVHKHSSRHTHSKSYRNRLHSDRYEVDQHSHYDNHKPRSKVAVVIKTQKRPTVASTIWSRITPKKERLKTASERLQSRRDSSSSESSSSGSSSSSSESQSDSSSESEDESNDEDVQPNVPLRRPGFSHASAAADRKSPLRIEINNDHFKEE